MIDPPVLAVDEAGRLYGVGAVFARDQAMTDHKCNYVAEFDEQGNVSWFTLLGTVESLDSPSTIVVDSGSLFVTGRNDATWGEPVHSFEQPGDIFIAKLTTAGKLIWNTFVGMGTAYSITPANFVVDAAGRPVVAGSTSWRDPVDPTCCTDGFAAQVDASGHPAWMVQTKAPSDDELTSVKADAQGHIIAAGSSFQPWGESQTPMHGGRDGVLAILDGRGGIAPVGYFGGAQNDSIAGLELLKDGRVLIAGSSDAAWGTPVHAYTGLIDGFVAEVQLGEIQTIFTAHAYLPQVARPK